MAEVIAWATVGVALAVVLVADLPGPRYPIGLTLVGVMAGAVALLFKVVLPRWRETPWVGWACLGSSLVLVAALNGLVRAEVAAVALLFVPVVAVMALLTSLVEGLVAAVAAFVAYLVSSALGADVPSIGPAALHGGALLLTGSVSGLLAREMRSHFVAEQREHGLATAVRHRLLAVLDAVDEGIVFRDRAGLCRVVNQRAAKFFDVDPDHHLGHPVVELLRTIARQMEDPEGFMEAYQELRDEPEAELRTEVEQIIPERRQLRLYSAPTHDDTGALVGRIDVFTDMTESVRRAAEVERLYEEARKTAESYQRSLLPVESPSLPRLNMVAHYVPAAGSRAVCGDFYDFVPLPEGKVGITLGDVCGIGPQAANDAALTRYTLRSFAAEEGDPGALLEKLNAHLHRHLPSERFGRILLGVLEPERARFEYANAGHVPPVVYRAATGDIEWLGEGGIALGIEPDAQYKSARTELHPGDMLVFYTDGVTDAWRLGRPLGQGKLSDIVREYGVGTPGEMVQALRRAVEAWVESGELRDDIALLVSQVVPDETISEPTRELVLPNEPSRISEVRAFVQAFLADLRAPVEDSQEFVLAVGEAAANSARYGRKPEGRSELRVRCSLEDGVVTVDVSDEGTGFDVSKLEPAGPPDRFASGGRGLFLMRALSDQIEWKPSPAGTTVTLRRRMFSP